MSTDSEKNLILNGGYVSSLFANNQESVTLENAFVLLLHDNLNNVSSLERSLVLALRLKRPVLLVVNDITAPAIERLVQYNKNDIVRIVCIQLPRDKESKQRWLKSITKFTSAIPQKLIGANSINKIVVQEFGRADKITIDHSTTTIQVES